VVAAVAMAAAGTALLVAYVKGAEDRATRGEELVDVLVVADRIARGTAAGDIGARVALEQVPVKVRAQGALTSLTPVAGMVAAVDLLPGEQVVSGRFATPQQVAGEDVPPGLLQVTISLDRVRAVGGTLRQGDTVGVVASFFDEPTTHLILHKVLVTGVRDGVGAQVTTRAAATSPDTLLVTLALDAPSVEKVVFAAEHGSLWLSKEPLEATEAGTKIQTKGSVNL
jgi:pilus assembly protein CpaB